MAAQQLGDYADTLASARRPLSFGEPQLHVETLDMSRFSDLTDWRGQLHVTNADDPAPIVVAGYVDFLVVRLRYRDVAKMLDSTPGRGEEVSDPAWFPNCSTVPNLHVVSRSSLTTLCPFIPCCWYKMRS
jgi:hypothetical protein